MKRKNSFGQIVITAMFVWSALLCHLEASSLNETGDITYAFLYWFFGFTAVLGALRFQIANLIELFLKYIKK